MGRKQGEANLAKHGVSFELARRVWDDPNLEIASQWEGSEERWLALGRVTLSTILVVVHVYRRDGDEEEIIRIISARKAISHARRRYERQAFQS